MALRIKVRDSKDLLYISQAKVSVYAFIHLFVLTSCLSVSLGYPSFKMSFSFKHLAFLFQEVHTKDR